MTSDRTGPEPDAAPREARPPALRRAAEARSMQRRWRSSELFGTETEVEIEHGEAVYRLRQTALGKLILTK